ncbi:hypothetical protein CHUAL_004234 [Chamberlinius hualienensis]
MLTRNRRLLNWPLRQRWLFRCNRFVSSAFKVLDGEINAELERHKTANDKWLSAENVYNKFQAQVNAGGGPKAVHRHTKINKKLLVQERLKLVLDDDNDVFTVASMAGLGQDYGDIPSAGGKSIIGKVGGHYFLVSANDSTVKAGTTYPTGLAKMMRSQTIAAQNRLPCIYLIDSGGAFLPLQSEIFPDKLHGGRGFRNQAVMQADGLPEISVVCGSCTAGAAYVPEMTQQSIMIKGISYIYLAGPPLVKAASGEVVTDDELGGTELHCKVSGGADYMVENEQEAFALCREMVETFNLTSPDFPVTFEEPKFPSSDLVYFCGLTDVNKEDILKIIARLLDGSRFHEFKAAYGRNLVTGFGYLAGMLVGVVGNSGGLSAGDGQKGAHFISMCNQRDIPLLFLQYSCPSEEQDGTSSAFELKEKSKMVAAVSCCQVPRIALNVGGCYGDDAYVMSGLSFNPNFLLSWPTALTYAAFPTKEQVERDGDLSKVDSAWDLAPSTAFSCAFNVLSDAIVLPHQSRQVLARCLQIAKHSQLPRKSNVVQPLFRM